MRYCCVDPLGFYLHLYLFYIFIFYAVTCVFRYSSIAVSYKRTRVYVSVFSYIPGFFSLFIYLFFFFLFSFNFFLFVFACLAQLPFTVFFFCLTMSMPFMPEKTFLCILLGALLFIFDLFSLYAILNWYVNVCVYMHENVFTLKYSFMLLGSVTFAMEIV